ncbi:MAG: hypothetical protein C0521_16760 [Xanthomonas sp.]|nr:hypothetical protein [Xanthomonas sp.]
MTSSSGLPVTLSVSGPASYSGGMLTLTGAGPVTIQATQPGNDTFLPAAPVVRSFNANAPALLRYATQARTLLQTGRTPESPAYIIQTNP